MLYLWVRVLNIRDGVYVNIKVGIEIDTQRPDNFV